MGVSEGKAGPSGIPGGADTDPEEIAAVPRPEWKAVRARRPTEDPVARPPVRRHPTPPSFSPPPTAEQKEALIARLSNPNPDAGADPLADVQAAPGEVPRLHSDTGLWAMWIAIALSLVVAGGFGVWAVFLRQPW